MDNDVRAFQPVAGDPGVLRALFQAAPSWLPDGQAVEGDRWTMTVRGGGLARTVTADVGPPRANGATVWRSLSWHPGPHQDGNGTGLFERLLPNFDGELGLHPTGGTASLMLDGRYRPPGGAVGAALDEWALHRVARRTVERLLGDVALALTAGAERVAAAEADAADAADTDTDAAAGESVGRQGRPSR